MRRGGTDETVGGEGARVPGGAGQGRPTLEGVQAGIRGGGEGRNLRSGSLNAR